jgi:hypothetical protein
MVEDSLRSRKWWRRKENIRALVPQFAQMFAKTVDIAELS